MNELSILAPHFLGWGAIYSLAACVCLYLLFQIPRLAYQSIVEGYDGSWVYPLGGVFWMIVAAATAFSFTSAYETVRIGLKLL